MGSLAPLAAEEQDKWDPTPLPRLGEVPALDLVPGVMTRTVSQVIRAEKEDLKEAARDTLNVVIDLNLDGRVRWVSPSWRDIVGTPCESIQDRPIADFLVEGKEEFQTAIETMEKDDSRSYKIRFAVTMGSMSILARDDTENAIAAEEEGFRPEEMDEVNNILEMEGQGILIFDRGSGKASHTMWVLRPFIEPKEITIDLPQPIVDSLGVGAGMLARYLSSLAEDSSDPANHPPPLPVLCRICECQIQPWWFEKHSELCMLEHKAESEVQMSQEALTIQRSAIVKVLDSMERASTARGQAAEKGGQGVLVEYRGFSIGPPSIPSSGTVSPGGTTKTKSRESPVPSHRKNFAVRRPQVRIVELLLDLCDTALEISTPSIKESSGTGEIGTFRTQSPGSEARINQVLQWQSPSTNTLDQEQGLALLCSDTESTSRAKVDAVLRHRNTIEYSERIRFEFSVLVQDCIEDAIRKVNAYDDIVDDGFAGAEDSELDYDTQFMIEDSGLPDVAPGTITQGKNASVASLSTMDREDSSSPAVESPRSSSPQECLTPKSQRSGIHGGSQHRSRFGLRHSSSIADMDGNDSDASGKSSLAAPVRTQSPTSDNERMSNKPKFHVGRDRKRHSLGIFQNGTNSPNRQPSPARNISTSNSPLRLSKPRLSAIFDGQIPTPITSPLLSTGELNSPALETFSHRRQSSTTLSDMRPPVSPRLTAVNPGQQKAAAPSIKDFEIIKPISKGAFGSVYLSKKKSTGDYFAIKVLKKADMIAKNQVTNVRAERAILMVQGESDFVAKLFWTFSSKDYLYLVMEYLNGGDCAALVKALGGLPEDWAKRYLAEVVLGIEHLHSRDIIHRDLKPDNLLIDQKGHLKLTDFGLSRMGLLGRQKRALQGSSESTPDLLKQGPFMRSRSVASSRSASFDFPPGTSSPANTPNLTPESTYQMNAPSYFNLNRESTLSREGSIKDRRRRSNSRSESGGSESLTALFGGFSLHDPASFGMVAARRANQSAVVEDDAQSTSSASSEFSSGFALQQVSSQSSQGLSVKRESLLTPHLGLFDPDDSNRKFVGTPDYLAPETINGTGQDEMSDWWSLGCILFEFVYGYPPFHADTHERVFDNILNRRIDWPDEDEEEVSISPEAKDMINRLLCCDQEERLGAQGAEEVKNHPFFEGLAWDELLEHEASFIPTPAHPEDTDYFDARGATLQPFTEELDDGQTSPAVTPSSEYTDRPHDAVPRSRKESTVGKRGLMPLHIPPHVREGGRSRRLSESVAVDDFGSFQFKNLPVLEKANKDVIQRLRTEALQSSTSGPNSSTSSPSNSQDGSPVAGKTVSRTLSSSSRSSKRAVSPSGLQTSTVTSPNRVSQPSSPLLVSFSAQPTRKASNASSTSTTSISLVPSNFNEIPRLATNFKVPISSTASSSPVKTHSVSPVKTFPLPLKPHANPTIAPTLSRVEGPNHRRSGSLRVRSLTVGSQDGEPPAFLDSLKAHKRRSQVFDMSPSSSDNEDSRSSALLRVQRRRQSSRRMSTVITSGGGHCSRPLDILVCEDHPVSRMVMERMLEKLQCRTMSVDNGPEAVRVAMSEVKFDIIFTETRLPQMSGEDVSRMVRSTKNANSGTPIVAVTGYLREMTATHYFNDLIEKPATPSRLIEILERLCMWKAPEDYDRSSPPRSADTQHYSPTVPTPEEATRRPSLERTVTLPAILSRSSTALSPKSFLDAARHQGLSRTSSEEQTPRLHSNRSMSFSSLSDNGSYFAPGGALSNSPRNSIISLSSNMPSPVLSSLALSGPPSPILTRPPSITSSKSTERFSRNSGSSLLSRAAVTARDFLLPQINNQIKEEPILEGLKEGDTPDARSPSDPSPADDSPPPEKITETKNNHSSSKWVDMFKPSSSSNNTSEIETSSKVTSDRTEKTSNSKKSSSLPMSPKPGTKNSMFTKHARVQSPPLIERVTSPTKTTIIPKDNVVQGSSTVQTKNILTKEKLNKMDNANTKTTKGETNIKLPSLEDSIPKSRFFRASNTKEKSSSLNVPKTDGEEDVGSPAVTSKGQRAKLVGVKEKRSRSFLSDMKRTKSEEPKG